MNQPTDRCAHAHCNCPAQWGTGFCSDYCRNAEAEAARHHECLCGHTECQRVFESAIEETIPAET